MDSQTELFYRERALKFSAKATEIANKLIEHKPKGEKLDQNIDIVTLLYNASSYQEDLINYVLHSDLQNRKLKHENSKLIQQIQLRDKKIKELKDFMTHE